MRRQTWILGLAVLGGIGWYAFRPELLFVRTHVNEAAPMAEPAVETGGAMGGDAMSGDAMSGGSMSRATEGTTAAPALLSGSFHSVAHETHGTAAIIRAAHDRLVLRLTDFTTSNGPDVRVYLVAAPDAGDNASVTQAGFVELGKLKGTDGDQNYDVPAGLDLGKYRAVTIWCRRFSVNFATAPLTPLS
jgi:hypothetical protein